jgi:hypothetical protein
MPGLPESTRLATPSGHPDRGSTDKTTRRKAGRRYLMQSAGHSQCPAYARRWRQGAGGARPATSSEPPGWPNRVSSLFWACCLAVRAVSWARVGVRVVFVTSAGPIVDCAVLAAEQWEGLVAVSETYTAVYERDGEAWAARIAEEPDVHILCPSLPEARESIRKALGVRLGTESAQLRIVDHFPLPTPVRTAQESVKATRTDTERIQMMASMTDPRTAMDWAEDLGIAMRDPVTVQALMDLGDREISIDTFCHTITMAEELSRLTATTARRSPDAMLDKD